MGGRERRRRPGGRARRSRRRAGRGCTRRRALPSYGVQPGRPAGAQRGEVEVEHLARVGDSRRAPATGRCGSAYAANTRDAVAVAARRPGRRTSSTRTPARPRPAGSRGRPRPSGSRASRSASSPHGPACSSSRKRGPSRRCRPAARRAARWRRRSGSRGRDRIIRRPRAAPPGPGAGRAPAGSAGRAGRRGRPAASSAPGADLLEGRAGARRVRRASGRRAAPRAGRRGRAARTGARGAGAAGWCRRGRATARTSVQPAREPRGCGWSGSGGPRPRPRRRRRPGVPRRRAPRAGRRARPASVARVVEVARRAGGRRARPSSTGRSAALDQAAPGELVDPEGDVQGDGLLGAGGVRGAGREVHRQAGLEQHLLDAVGGVHLPLLGAVRSGTRRRRGSRSAPRSPASRAG